MNLRLQNIPPQLHQALCALAQTEGKTVPQVAVEALAVGLGLNASSQKKRDLSDIAGTWIDDPIFEVIREFHDRDP